MARTMAQTNLMLELERFTRFMPRIYTQAEKGHINRAATRVFGSNYKLLINGCVRSDNLDYRYSFETGRFYGLEYVGFRK